MEIKANAKGSRFIDVTEKHLDTIKKYSLFNDLVGSDGFVDETTLLKLQQNVRSLLESGSFNDKDLIELCFDVIYHRDMKALGLRNLMLLYISYNDPSEAELDIEGFTPEEMLTEVEEDE